MAKKNIKKPKETKIVVPKASNVEKIKVVEVPVGPTNLELSIRIAVLSARLDRIVDTISKSKSVKGM